MESAFLQDYSQRFAAFRRAAIVLGLLLWSAFVWWDWFAFHSNPGLFSALILRQVLLLRALGIGILLGMFWLSLGPRFKTDGYAHWMLLSGVFLIAMCLIGMVMLVPAPLDYVNYFVGLYLILFFYCGFLHLRAQPIFITTVLITLTLLILQFGDDLDIPVKLLTPEHFKMAIFYYTGVCITGYGVCVKFERYARKQYKHEQQLIVTNDHLQRKNVLLAIEQHDNVEKAQALIQSKETQRTMAVQANQNKSRFLACAAHDLRQPMFGLSLSLEALRHALEHQNREEMQRLLGLAQCSAKTMAASFNAVLDLSKLESGFVEPQLTLFDVVHLIDEVRAEMSHFADDKAVLLRVHAPLNTVSMVQSDRAMLSRILKNLISNAIKYADPNKECGRAVLIGVIRLPTHVRIDIVDNGVGIAKAQWHHIFEPFVQLSNPERDREKGLGLGLSIVNAMIAILPEHRLALTSQSMQGTRFSLHVPKKTGTALRQDTPTPAQGATFDLSLTSMISVAGLYVVLVEDDSLVRNAMETVFNQWGILVDAVGSIAQLTELLDDVERIPDLVITDYRFSETVSAHDVVHLIRSRCQRPSQVLGIPILMVSGEADALQLGAAIGADAVLTKPVLPEELKLAITKLAVRCRTGDAAT